MSLALGDFNNDGKLDVAAATANLSARIGYLSILLGNGDGTFQPFQSYPVDLNPELITVGDFNADGKLDLAITVCAPTGSGFCGAATTVSIFLGNGDGSFRPQVAYPGGPAPQTIITGDFNGDNVLDLAISGYKIAHFSPQGIGILLGNGDGSFQNPSFIAGPYLLSYDG